jgi:hypothetical protein
VNGYDSSDVGGWVRAFKWLSPVNSTVGVVGGINGVINAGESKIFTKFAMRAAGGASGYFRGTFGMLGDKGMLGSGRLAAASGAAGIGFGLGFSSVPAYDAFFGKEQFMRQAMLDCNQGNPEATNKVDPSFLQNPFGLGNYGAAKGVVDSFRWYPENR